MSKKLKNGHLSIEAEQSKTPTKLKKTRKSDITEEISSIEAETPLNEIIGSLENVDPN